ncbi:MAG: hypothetical protein PHV61_02750 [Limnochordia bacterium]|nr:hypothetical protein [Limnochordia bacterium]MDD2629078.1 hypothetical protein [Limnochordia bacterium]MDD4517579.1 hypothetical protein [Limnochordia bacterium]
MSSRLGIVAVLVVMYLMVLQGSIALSLGFSLGWRKEETNAKECSSPAVHSLRQALYRKPIWLLTRKKAIPVK